MKVSKKLKKIVSVLLAVVLIITMLPKGQIVMAADGGMNVTFHFYDVDKTYAGKVYLQYWGGSAEISFNKEAVEPETYSPWNVQCYPLTSEEATEGEDWYGLEVKGSMEGFQFFDVDPDKSKNCSGNVYNASMASYEGDLYFKEGKWYTENPVKNEDAAELKLLEPKMEFYLVGDQSLLGANWDPKDTTHRFTENPDGTYSYKMEAVEKGSYPVKALQDPENFAWKYAWGGSGEGGNFVLELDTTSDVVFTLDPKDSNYKLQAEITPLQAASNIQSPVYNDNGTVTFYYESAVSNAAIGFKGNLVDTRKKTMLPATLLEKPLENGNYLYAATSAAIKASGIYKYNIYELDEKGVVVKKLADSACKTKYGSDSAFVRNPVVNDLGEANIYYPYDGEGAQVYYKKNDSENAKTLNVGDVVTEKTAEEYGYKVADMKEDKAFSGGGMYSAAICEDAGTYSYVIVKDGKVQEDKFNYGKNEFEAPKVDRYTYTIHYHAEDKEDYTDRALWIWESTGQAYNTVFLFNDENYVDPQGRVWATATYSFPSNDIKAIVRPVDSWDGQEDERRIVVDKNKKGAEVWFLKGSSDTFYEYQDEFSSSAKRSVIVEYDRPAGDYEGWNLYTWSASTEYKNISNYFKEVNGKYQTVFCIEPQTELVGYLLRDSEDKDGDWSNVKKDMEGDRSINTPLDQQVIKVRLKQGSLEAEYVPFNKGYEMNPNEKKINFYYRDDAKLVDGTLGTLKSVKVDVDGTEYDMSYNAKNERYECTVENPTAGQHEYFYEVVDAEDNSSKVLDLFNDEKNEAGDKSVLTYQDLTTNVTVTCNNANITYDDNTVIKVAVDNEDIKVTSAYADLTALGGKAKVAINPELMALTIGVTDQITAGEKEVPVTVVDQYNKSYKGSVKINVKTRTAVNDKDFDWDEAVIYFMMTDRFKDGNASNNDAYGVGDYDLKGGSSYHGGDFAGVTQKINEGYFDKLGINTIWITPVVENILENQSPDGLVDSYGYTGYWASSFTKLNKHLGTIEEFHRMINTAHDHGIRIMVDVVLNHAGYGADDAENSEFAGMTRPSEDCVSSNDILKELDGLPDFATERAEVRKKLVEWQQAWVSTIGKTSRGDSIDYFRVDTVKHVESTTWNAFKNAMTEVSSKFKMIGEYYGAAYTDDFGYLHSGTMDSLLDFGFNDMANAFVTGNVTSVEQQLENRNKVIDNAGTLGSFINSHDEDGLKYYIDSLKNDDKSDKYTTAQADALAKVAASLYITAKGQPVIYYGEEIGLTGAANYPASENRYDMKFDNLSASETAMLKHYQTMLGIRKAYSKVFAKGTRTSIGGSDKEQYVAFERSYNGQNVVVALNIAEQDKTVTLTMKDFAGTEIKDIYNNTTYKVAVDGTVSVVIPANAKGGTAVFVKDVKATQDVANVAQLTEAQQKDQTIQVYSADEKNDANALWTFSKNDSKKATVADINLKVSVSDTTTNAAITAVLAKDAKNVSGTAITFAHQGALAVNAKVRVNLSANSSIPNGSKVYVYYWTGSKLQETVMKTATVSQDGYVTLKIAKGGTYVLLLEKAASAISTKLLNTIQVKAVGTSIKVGKSKNIKVTLPVEIKKVASFTQANMKKIQCAELGAKVTYKSSNAKIATVSSAGKIKAKKKGNVSITTTVRLSNGQKISVVKKFTIKK